RPDGEGVLPLRAAIPHSCAGHYLLGEQGKKLGVVGWVKNTPRGTVTGQVQGPKEKTEIMKNWLRNVGSPMSRIDRAVFSNEREISTLEFPNFSTKY
uniref:Acylphosphatase-like domain-containing protein n=1 Tax=Pelusios castaneus TaxID=367368 RepID=A0A8C8RR19_9SAUR